MRNILSIAVALTFMVSCNQNKSADVTGDTAGVYAERGASVLAQQASYSSYGAKINAEDAISAHQAREKYADLKAGDTAVVKFEAPINAVCKSKGCWMQLETGEETVFVKFKDYGFFVPTDATGDAIVEGKAYLEEVSVAELKHMAKDGGKTEAEIAAITEPQRELRFMADGVLIKGK
jgi:hypothetical protein